MEYITNAFRYVLGFQNKKEVCGYVVYEDGEHHRTLVMVQEGENYWTSKWYNEEEYVVTPLEGSLNAVFMKRVEPV